MSDYYRPRRTKNLFDPSSKASFKLSRSKIDLFFECPRCFYADRRLGVGRPPGFPFNLNSAVDLLLKREFDRHRKDGTPHPLMDTYGIDAVPFRHKNMDVWRENFVGVQHLDKPSNFLVFGAVDDIWVNKNDELIVVDYKATSKDGQVNLDAEWQNGYKRQMEVYQWLLRGNGFVVSSTGYFVYANGKRDKDAFDGVLDFDISIIPYTGDDSWISKVLTDAKNCLLGDIPPYTATCDYCAYTTALNEVVGDSGVVVKKEKNKVEPKATRSGDQSLF